MSLKRNTQNKIQITRMGLGMALGLILGGIVGLVSDNLVIFAGGGMVIGLALGTALEKSHQS